MKNLLNLISQRIRQQRKTDQINHRRIPREEVSLILVFCAMLCFSLYSIVPKGPLRQEVRAFFPYYDIKVTFQVWIDYAAVRVAASLLLFSLYLVIPKFKLQVLLIWILSIGYLADYLLRYNMPGENISYTVFMYFAISAIILKSMFDE